MILKPFLVSHGTLRMHFSGWTISIIVLILGLLAGVATGAGADALDEVARRYRMQVYESYRLNRPELDRHLQTAQALMDAWRDRGAPEGEIVHLIDWLQRATRASKLGHPGALPEYIVPASVDQSLESSAADEDVVERDPDRVPRDISDEHTARAAADRRTTRPSPTPPRAEANSRSTQSRPAHPDELPPLKHSDFVPERPIADGPFAEQLPKVRLRTAVPSKSSTETQHSSAVPATPLESYVAPIRPSIATQRTDVDLEKLTAKIRSINLSLTAIESELVEGAEWKVEALDAVVHDLTRLFDAANLAQLYYGAIPVEQQEKIEPLNEPGTVQALFAQRVFETRIRLVDESRATPSGELNEQLDRLEVISDAIRRWSGDQQR